MVRGPLVPGWNEFDGPRRGVPRVIWWLIGIVVVVGLTLLGVGVFRAAGPFAGLGLQTSSLQPIAYRPTTEDAVLQVALSVPAESLCRDDRVVVSAVPAATTIRISAVVSRVRNEACESDPTITDPLWIDVTIDGPLAGRDVVRDVDGDPLPLQATTGTTG